jgi:hypothetical protein
MPTKNHGIGKLALSGQRLPAAPPDHGAGKSKAGHAFVVRLWRETRDGSRLRPLWRGTVSDLRGHHLGSFGISEELVDILIDASEAVATLRRHDDGDGLES